jgi:hypothetical protein
MLKVHRERWRGDSDLAWHQDWMRKHMRDCGCDIITREAAITWQLIARRKGVARDVAKMVVVCYLRVVRNGIANVTPFEHNLVTKIFLIATTASFGALLLSLAFSGVIIGVIAML